MPHLGCEMAGDMDLEEEDPVGEGEGLGLGLGLGRGASGALTPSSRDSGRPSSLPSWNNGQLQELVVIVKKLQQVIIPQKCFNKYLYISPRLSS